MRHYLISMVILALLSGCSNTTTQEHSNDEYDRLYMGNLIFSACDIDANGVVTKQEVPNASNNNYKREMNAILAQKGADEISRESFLDSYTTPPNQLNGELHSNLEYKKVGERRLMMDLYLPKTKRAEGEKTPIVMFIHGGGWKNGYKYIINGAISQPLAQQLLDRGFAVATTNYRLVDATETFVEHCIIDTKDALAYLNSKSEQYGLDSERMFVWGQSAGAHLAMMIGLSDKERFEGDESLAKSRTKPRGAIAWFGPTYFDGEQSAHLYKSFTPSSDPETIRQQAFAMGPVNHVDSSDSAILIMTGEEDAIVKPEQAYILENALSREGVPHEMVIVKGAGHSWSGKSIDPTMEQIREITINFIEGLL